jgi:hypothetical protein
MGTGPVRPEEPCNGGKGDTRDAGPAQLRRQYEPPALTVHGSLVELTQKRALTPGRDNPHFQRSF